jgi:hypothetical protein
VKRIVLAGLALLTVLGLLLCFPGTAKADEAYIITNDDVNIKISTDNTLDVTETMTLNYTQSRHGFYYYVQDGGVACREYDGQVYKTEYRYEIKDFNVEGHEFSLSRESNDSDSYLVAQIGSEDEYVTGEQTYVITYTCSLGDNGEDAFDEFYRNLIICAYGNTIENASFTIDMPRDFDESDVFFYLGDYGAGSSDDVIWEKNGNTITGYVTRPMTGEEYLTAQIWLPESYFGDNSALIGLIALFVLARLL